MMANRPGREGREIQRRFAQWTVTVRWQIVAAVLALVGLALSGVFRLTSATDYRTFFSDDNPELLAFEALENTYGKSDHVLFMIAPDNGDALSEQALAATVWLSERAWQAPFSSRVDSIANFQQTQADGDDLSVFNLVDAARLDDAQDRARIRETALTDPRLAGSIVARDGGVSAVSVTIKLPEENDPASTAEVAEFARDLAAEAAERFPGIDFLLAGTIILNHAFTEATAAAFGNVLPASLAIMALLLIVLTRGLGGVAAAGLAVVLSVLATLGLGGWAGIPFSTSTSAVPVIVLTVAVANCVHVLVSFRKRLAAGDSRRVAVAESVAANLGMMSLASVTTALGFLTMLFSEVPPYRHLGVLVAIGAVVSFALSVTLLPALLSLLPVRIPAAARRRHGWLMAAIAEFTVRHRRGLLWISLGVILALAAAVPRNELNDVLTHFFDEDVEVRRNADFLDERLSGNTVLEYSLVSNGSGGVTEPAFLEDVSAFADWYRDQPEVRHVMSISDTFRQLNMNMNGDDPAAYRLPESRPLASQYLLLFELSLPFGLDLNNRIDIDKSATRVTVTARTLSTSEVLELDARALAWLDGNAPNIVRAESSGAAIMFAHIGDRNIQGMILGTAIAFLVISILLVFAFRSVRIGLTSLVPNFVPGLLGFGIWGLAVGQIGLALSVVMAMTIGIVVDDTVHFLGKYLRARRDLGQGSEDAVRYAFEHVGQALFTTTVILVAGFLVLGMSDFFPTAQMGQLTAAIIALALICDFLFLPPLLMTLDRRQPKSP